MIPTKKSVFSNTPFSILLAICTVSAFNWASDHYWLYHSQNRVLNPEDFEVKLTPVTANMSPGYKITDDGRYVVEVRTLGTAHALPMLDLHTVPMFFLGLMGLGSLVLSHRRSAGGGLEPANQPALG
jgi:hypothetical protein